MNSVSAERKTYAILDAAYELFGTRGFYETKISEVAEQAGIAKGTVYLYFKNKEELFMAVTRRDCEGFIDELRRRLRACETTGQQLAVIAEHHMRYYYERKRHTNLFFRTPHNNAELKEYMSYFMKTYMQTVQSVLSQGGAEEAELLAQSYIGMLDRLKMDILFQPDFSEADAQARAAFAAGLFLEGAAQRLTPGAGKQEI
ncbi:TetR/AcrR family transcriptional regulator ['Paenibacillus yunnanensis' Narsing Rao et al. 2020]|uniref:TetR/AcrR family transcriptional regulator n=1 Tax=Paenibacillus tengchongensis TaxID=2608684 RepID=UPI00124E4E08|nr:TetR/AcrR family transcriptional regulator [Paenibacillus tengchongensis]